MKLKTLTIFLNEQAVRLSSTGMKGETPITQPIDFDPETKVVTWHMDGGKKRVIDLSKVLMFEYEEEKPLLQS